MAYYLQKPSLVDSNIVVYYAGNSRWTDDASQKTTFATEDEVNSLMYNPEGKNGGWSNVTIVSE